MEGSGRDLFDALPQQSPGGNEDYTADVPAEVETKHPLNATPHCSNIPACSVRNLYWVQSFAGKSNKFCDTNLYLFYINTSTRKSASAVVSSSNPACVIPSEVHQMFLGRLVLQSRILWDTSFDNNGKSKVKITLSQSTPWTRIRETSALGGQWFNITPRALYLRARTAVPTEQEAGWVSEPVGATFLKIKISCPCRDSNTEPCSPQRVPVLTSLSWLRNDYILSVFSNN